MRKLLLSLFVVLSFAAYAIHNQLESLAGNTAVNPPTSPPGAVNSASPTATTYRDGQYTGDIADAFYGNVQVQITISGGRLTDVTFLDYPRDRRTSQMINMMATPLLKQEAIAAQSAKVDIVSGATQTSNAFIQSLQSALARAG